jgi:hypothetical protein
LTVAAAHSSGGKARKKQFRSFGDSLSFSPLRRIVLGGSAAEVLPYPSVFSVIHEQAHRFKPKAV